MTRRRRPGSGGTGRQGEESSPGTDRDNRGGGEAIEQPGVGPVPEPSLHLLSRIWIASCPTCGFQLATGRTQARVERRAAGRVCPICRDDDAA